MLYENTIREVFDEKSQKFKSVQRTLEENIYLLVNKEVNIIKIESRVKEYSSFFTKLKYGNYSIEDINDLFGLRIVCYYLSDIEKIISVVKNNFNVIIEKNNMQETQRFGYRSHHLIVKIKEEWCNLPKYKEIKNMNFEIQIRTVIMHSWAAISHNLFYKKERSSEELNRQLASLSAILENADKQFDDMKLR